MNYESIISELFNKAESRSALIVPRGKAYTEDCQSKTKIAQKLLASLSEDQKELFEEYESAQYEVSGIEDTEIFRHGVSLGVRFTIEAMLLNNEK